MDIILISGKSHSGKGTVAKFIQEIFQMEKEHVIRCSLSTYIRDLAKKDFYWNGIDTLESRILMAEIYRIGTDFYPYHMARRVWERDILPYAKTNSIIIIESFREKVNYDFFYALQQIGYINKITTVRVIRPYYNDIQNKEFEKHVSESDLDEFVFDKIIINDGTKEKLLNTLNKEFSILYKPIPIPKKMEEFNDE